MLDALIPASVVLQEVFVRYCCVLSFCLVHTLVLIYLLTQRLNVGDDPSVAFVFSSEAALAGAESTKCMQAQVRIELMLFFIRLNIIPKSS